MPSETCTTRPRSTTWNTTLAPARSSFRIQNQTGHKLISGYPEGRRMFVNVRLYDAGDNLIGQINPYDSTIGTLKGLPGSPSSPPLGSGESTWTIVGLRDECQQHADRRGQVVPLRAGRRPLQGQPHPAARLRHRQAGERLAQPVWQGVDAPDYFTAAEYAGGYDHVSLLCSRRGEGRGRSLLPDHQPRIHGVPARRDQRTRATRCPIPTPARQRTRPTSSRPTRSLASSRPGGRPCGSFGDTTRTCRAPRRC